MKKVVQDLTSAGLDWQREKWKSGFGSKFIHQGEKNAVKYADEIIVLSKGVQDYFQKEYGRKTVIIPNGVNRPEVVDDDLITKRFDLHKNEYFLFLGRLVPEKGIRYLVEAFKEVKTDKKLVIAGGASDKMYALQPAETIITNVIGTKNVLEYCKKNIDTRLLLTSTFEVYGKIDGIDVYSENMVGLVDFHMLRNGYTESKRCAEMLVNSYIDEYGIDAVICRLASIYGPTMLLNDSKAHAQFIRNALHGENIALKSKGEQRRTYCYVLDAVSALFMVLSKGEIGEAYNIANENSVASIADVASCCAKIVGTKVVFDIPDTVESKGFSKPQNCILDNKKLKSLGWEGRYSLEEGFTETIDELRKNERRGQKSLCLNN